MRPWPSSKGHASSVTSRRERGPCRRADRDRDVERSTLIRIRGDGLLHKTTTSKAGRACPAAYPRHGDVASPVAARLPIRHARPPQPRQGIPGPLQHAPGADAGGRGNGFVWVTSHNFWKTTDTILDEA